MGRYYDEASMGNVRIDLERRVSGWPGVRPGQMFGCPCFYADDRMFMFVATGGVVLSQLDEGDRDRVAEEFRAGPFAPTPGRAATKWSHVPVSRPEDLDPLMPWIRRSYEAARGIARRATKSASTETPSRKRRRR
jgi:hypothetical protein